MLLVSRRSTVYQSNKVDKGDEREVPERIGQDFSEVNGFDYFLETSALDATNVDNLYSHYKSDPNSGNQPINLVERAQNTINACCGRT
ncbi:hypothetical protein OESDEN_04067 [Oesophagostomum dentatum]|uniref:Uncharacterized protein n=1 Tax=Oesophagostomum dentatum TaxID=61180 RepID=A0A0B1TKM7_OESDE|nr:hypothetical protein OESDEN_04067 [Oesophagostomum dentatum]